MKLNIGKIFSILLLIILLPILFFNITIMFKTFIVKEEVPSVFGYMPMIVASGSMEDTIMVGDLIIDKKYDGKILNESDIVTFKDSNSSIVTHRIVRVEKVSNEVRYYTKGDNNNTLDDDYIISSDIIGVYLMHFSKVGLFLGFIQTPIGALCLVILVFALGAMICLLNKDKDNKVLSNR